VLFLSRANVEALLDLDALIDALGTAFVDLSAGRASVPARVMAVTPDGWLGAMPGFVPGALEAKLIAVFPDNHRRGLPSHQGIIALFDPETGTALAVMDGTSITAARTAAASALATRTLARDDAEVLAVIGAGVQARAHLEVVPRVRTFREIRVANRTRAAAETLADAFGAVVAGGFESAVRGADVVCLCTDASAPVIDGEWLHPGAHVSSVGASFGGGELDERTLRASSIFVESRVAFEPPPAGAFELAGFDPDASAELGEVLSGVRPGRVSPDEITVYKSMGHAVEDITAARLVYERALDSGAGVRLEL
jgi:alanine dehydrogenase